MKAEQVADDESELGLAVIKHQATGVELIVDMGGRKRQEAADDGLTQWRREGADRSSCQQGSSR